MSDRKNSEKDTNSFIKKLGSSQNKKSLKEKVAESQIEMNEAVTKLVNGILDFFAKPDMYSPEESTVSYATGTQYTKDDVLSIIQTMRKDRATFKIIASYLKEKKIPTFSGRGEWYAQTIHRLCKRHNLD